MFAMGKRGHRTVKVILKMKYHGSQSEMHRGCQEETKSTSFFNCGVGYLNSSFVPTKGHLPVYFQKILLP